jgi:hypothetical protein
MVVIFLSDQAIHRHSRFPIIKLDASKSPIAVRLAKESANRVEMRQHLQMSADVMSILEKTSDAMAARDRMRETGKKPRDMTT